MKNGCHFLNMCHTEKFQITDSHKVGVSVFLSVNANKILLSAIMKKSKKWLPFCKYALYGKMSNYQPPKVWVSGFLNVEWNISISLYEKIEKWPPFCKCASYRKNSNYQPPIFTKWLMPIFCFLDTRKTRDKNFVESVV